MAGRLHSLGGLAARRLTAGNRLVRLDRDRLVRGLNGHKPPFLTSRVEQRGRLRCRVLTGGHLRRWRAGRRLRDRQRGGHGIRRGHPVAGLHLRGSLGRRRRHSAGPYRPCRHVLLRPDCRSGNILLRRDRGRRHVCRRAHRRRRHILLRAHCRCRNVRRRADRRGGNLTSRRHGGRGDRLVETRRLHAGAVGAAGGFGGEVARNERFDRAAPYRNHHSHEFSRRRCDRSNRRRVVGDALVVQADRLDQRLALAEVLAQAGQDGRELHLAGPMAFQGRRQGVIGGDDRGGSALDGLLTQRKRPVDQADRRRRQTAREQLVEVRFVRADVGRIHRQRQRRLRREHCQRRHVVLRRYGAHLGFTQEGGRRSPGGLQFGVG